QQAARVAVGRGHKAPSRVDARSDIYSLGKVLYEALVDSGPLPREHPLPLLCRLNPQVSVGLSDIVQRCLAASADDRYHDALGVGRDLLRHLEHLPLKGVANRSLAERWRKWRRRRPHALAVTMLVVGLTAALGTTGVAVVHSVQEGRRQAEAALHAGREQ